MSNKLFTIIFNVCLTGAVLYLGSYYAHRTPSKEFIKRLKKNIESKTPQVLTVNVGQGSCHMLICPAEELKVVIFDCGSLSSLVRQRTHKEHFDSILAKLKPKKLKIIVSHADEDHYNLLGNLPFTVHTKPEIFVEAHQLTPFVQSIKGNFIQLISSRHRSCGNATYQILRQPIRHHLNNQNSLMLLIHSKAGTGLLTADITGTEEKFWLHYLAPYAPLNFVSASHHGSTSHHSNHKKWAATLKAKKLIVSAARVPRWLHPRCAAVSNFLPYLSQTTNQHEIHCGNFKKGYRALETSRAAYTTNDQGNIVIELGDTDKVFYHK